MHVKFALCMLSEAIKAAATFGDAKVVASHLQHFVRYLTDHWPGI